jgi:hypothetical protein
MVCLPVPPLPHGCETKPSGAVSIIADRLRVAIPAERGEGCTIANVARVKPWALLF